MKRISSGLTFFYKRIFPVFWFGFLAVFIVAGAAASWRTQNNIPLVLILMPLGMAIFGFFIMKNLVFDLADEVIDQGDTLLIRKGALQDTIALKNITNVSLSMTNPPRITLSLNAPSVFGNEVTFAPIRPVMFFNPFKNQIAQDLIARTTALKK